MQSYDMYVLLINLFAFFRNLCQSLFCFCIVNFSCCLGNHLGNWARFLKRVCCFQSTSSAFNWFVLSVESMNRSMYFSISFSSSNSSVVISVLVYGKLMLKCVTITFNALACFFVILIFHKYHKKYSRVLRFIHDTISCKIFSKIVMMI